MNLTPETESPWLFNELLRKVVCRLLHCYRQGWGEGGGVLEGVALGGTVPEITLE